jgi:hypothetical protein
VKSPLRRAQISLAKNAIRRNGGQTFIGEFDVHTDNVTQLPYLIRDGSRGRSVLSSERQRETDHDDLDFVFNDDPTDRLVIQLSRSRTLQHAVGTCDRPCEVTHGKTDPFAPKIDSESAHQIPAASRASDKA